MQKFLRFLRYFLRSSKKCCIFAVESPTSGFRGWEVSPLGKPTCLTKDPSHGFRHFIKKGVIRTLFLALRNLVNSILFQGIAAIDVLRICDSWRVYFIGTRVRMHIRRGLRCCLFGIKGQYQSLVKRNSNQQSRFFVCLFLLQ